MCARCEELYEDLTEIKQMLSAQKDKHKQERLDEDKARIVTDADRFVRARSADADAGTTLGR